MRSLPAKIVKLFGIIALLATVFFLMLFLDRFNISSRSLIWHAARNFGHAPLFGVVAIVILWLLQLSFGRRLNVIYRYSIAMLAAIGLGALTEYMQFFTQRDADIMDWIFDIAGAAAFLSLYYSLDPHLPENERRGRDRIKVPLRLAAVLILLAAGIPTMIGAAASWHRRTAFPEMYTFSGYLERQFLESTHAEVEYVEAPPEWSGHDSRVARVTFMPAMYPGLAFKGPFPDWHGYRSLTLNIFSPADSAISIHLMVKDHERAGYDERYNGVFEIQQGYNEIRIPVEEIENAPAKRRLDMAAIHVIHLFIIEPKQPFTLYIDDIALE